MQNRFFYVLPFVTVSTPLGSQNLVTQGSICIRSSSRSEPWRGLDESIQGRRSRQVADCVSLDRIHVNIPRASRTMLESAVPCCARSNEYRESSCTPILEGRGLRHARSGMPHCAEQHDVLEGNVDLDGDGSGHHRTSPAQTSHAAEIDVESPWRAPCAWRCPTPSRGLERTDDHP